MSFTCSLFSIKKILFISLFCVFSQNIFAASSAVSMPGRQTSAGLSVANGNGFDLLVDKVMKPELLTTKKISSDHYQIDNALQKVQAQITPNGVIFKSTTDDSGSFALHVTTLGREKIYKKSPSLHIRREMDVVIHEHSDGLIEKFSNSNVGIRQDFILPFKPQGVGDLRLNLSVANAMLEMKDSGVEVIPNNSTRKLTYDRLLVTDAKGKTIPARMQLIAKNQLAIVVNDQHAQYPLTIDPTVSAGEWNALGSGIDGYVYAVALDKNGNLYVGGQIWSAGGVAVNNIAKWDGNNWSALGSGITGNVKTLIVDNNNNLYAGGYFTEAGGVTANYVAKWDGSNWSALGSGMSYAVFDLVVDRNNNLYAGGYFTSAGGISANRVAKWNGNNWEALGSGINNFVYALALDSNSNLYVGGSFSSAGGTSANSIAKWNGEAWNSLGTGIYSSAHPTVYSLAIDSNNNLYVGGEISSVGGVPVNNIAKWNGTSWSALGNGLNNAVMTLGVDAKNNLYAGGLFIKSGDENLNNIAKWNGTAWSALGVGLGMLEFGENNGAIGYFYKGLGGYVYALQLSNNGEVYAGGFFTHTDQKAVKHIAKWTASDAANGSVFEKLKLKGCSGFGKNSAFSLGYFASSIQMNLDALHFSGGGAMGKNKIIASLDSDSQNLLKSYLDNASGCSVAITGSKINLTLNKRKTMAKIDAKFTMIAPVTIKGKSKNSKGVYTLKGNLAWTPAN